MPIFYFQTRDAFKFAGVAGDGCQVVGQNRTSDQQIIRADGLSQRGEAGPKPPGVSDGGLIQRQQLAALLEFLQELA